jgi:hypothetical protein
MAKSKTGSFWLSETVELPSATASGTVVQGTVDLGAYVDVGDQQAIAIEYVDFIWQRGSANASDFKNMLDANGALESQLTDLNPGTEMLIANDNSLVASGALNIDQANNIGSHAGDFYPDSFGRLDEARMVVNDSLYLTAAPFGANISATHQVNVTCRIKCRVVKLSTKDWMAIAIQSTASDN